MSRRQMWQGYHALIEAAARRRQVEQNDIDAWAGINEFFADPTMIHVGNWLAKLANRGRKVMLGDGTVAEAREAFKVIQLQNNLGHIVTLVDDGLIVVCDDGQDCILGDKYYLMAEIEEP